MKVFFIKEPTENKKANRRVDDIKFNKSKLNNSVIDLLMNKLYKKLISKGIMSKNNESTFFIFILFFSNKDIQRFVWVPVKF